MNLSLKTCVLVLRLINSLKPVLKNSFSIAMCLAIGLQPVMYEFAYAQSITTDPTAPRANRPSITRSATGRPTINIVAPKAGVSHNRYNTLSTNSGAIFNNSRVTGTSKTGGKVTANRNLRTSGTAKVIVNEVRGNARTSLKGSLEVFGAKADVIIANQNGLTCDGCSFVNTGRATLSTGAVSVRGSGVTLGVKRGDVTIGRGGVSGADTLNLAGRHVIINGRAVARDTITASGGAQVFNPATGASSAAPSDKARNAPYAVDATAFGSMQAGNIRVIGNESGLGVRLDGKMTAGRDISVYSRGDATVRNFSAGRNVSLRAAGNVTQTRGTGTASGNISVSARRFDTAPGARLIAGNAVTIRTNETLTVAGEIRGRSIDVRTQKATTNLGKVISSEQLTIVAGEITNRRSVSQSYTKTFDPRYNWLRRYVPWITWFVKTYPRHGWSNYYRYLLNASHKTVANQQTLGSPALLQGRNVSLTATSGNITNEANIIATGGTLRASARRDIINRAQIERDRQSNGSYRTTYHAASMSGHNISLTAGRYYTTSRASLKTGGSLYINAHNSLVTAQNRNVSGSITLVSRGGTVTNNRILQSGGHVYLSGRTGVTNTSSIKANDISLLSSAGGIANRGYLHAYRDTTMISDGSIDNFYAIAKRNLKVESRWGSVTNRYVAYGYNTLNVKAYNDIVNQGYASRHSYMYGGYGATLSAGANVRFNGSRLWSYRDINITAGTRTTGSVIVTGVETRKNFSSYAGRPYAKQVWTSGSKGTWRGSWIQAYGGGSIKMTALRGNVDITGSDVIAGRNMSLYAAGSVAFKGKDYSDSVRTYTRQWYTYRKRRWWRWRTYWSYYDRVNTTYTKRYAGSNVKAGQDVSINAGSNLNIGNDFSFGRNLYATSRGGTVTNNRGIKTAGYVSLSGRRGVVNNSTIDAKAGINLVSSAGGIKNIRAYSDRNITMRAYGSIDNFDARARQHLNITSTRGNVTNRYVAYGYNTLNVNAYGDITNQGYGSRHSYMYGGYGANLTAGANVRFNGARLWSYRDINIKAGTRTAGSVIITGVETRTPTSSYAGRAYATQVWTSGTTGAWRDSWIQTYGGGNIALTAYRGNVDITGSRVKAGGNVSLYASGTVGIKTKDYSDRITKRTRQWYTYRKRRWWRWRTYWSYYDRLSTYGTKRYAKADVSAGRNMSISAGSNLNLAGGFSFGGNLYAASRGGTLTNSRTIDTKGNVTLSGRRGVTNTNSIRANDITILSSAGGISNRGHIHAYRDTTMISDGTIDNHYAIANRNLNVESRWGSVINRYVAYGYNTLNVKAYNDIVNQGYASRHSYMYGGYGATLTAGANVRFNGARLWGYRDINITAGARTGGSVIITGIASSQKIYSRKSGSRYGREIFTDGYRNSWRESIIETKSRYGTLNIRSLRGNVDLTGSDLRAAGNMNISASSNVNLNGRSFNDTETKRDRRWYSWTTGRWWWKRRHWGYRDYVSNRTIKSNYANADVVASGNVSIKARNVNGSGIWMSGSNVSMSSSDKINLTSVRKLNAQGDVKLYARNSARVLGNVSARNISFWGTPNVTIGGTYRQTGSRDLNLLVWRDLTVEGTLNGDRDVTLQSAVGNVVNKGTINARRDIRLSANTPSHFRLPRGTVVTNKVINNGRINAGRLAYLSGARGVDTKGVVANQIQVLSSRGAINATGALVGRDSVEVDAYSNVVTRGVIADDVSLTSRYGSLSVQGWKSSDGNDTQTAKQVFAARLAAATDGLLTQGDVANRAQGVVHAFDNLTLNSRGKFSVLNGMTVSSEGDLTINAGAVDVISRWTGSKLLRSAILTGGDLTLNTTGAVRNYAGTLSAKGGLYINAGGNIENRAIQTSFRLTAAHGCEGNACGRNGISFSGGEILSGEGMILTSRASVINEASQIAAAGSIMIHARDHIKNTTRSGQYRIVDIYKKKKFLFITISKLVRQENRAVIESGVIQTEYGDLNLKTDRYDIVNTGSFLSSGGDLTVEAGRDAVLNAQSFEVHNLFKKRGFSGFLTYSSNKTYWNNFATALSQLEGMNVSVSSGRDVKGIGATIMALNDLTMHADRDMSFDAKQNKKYLTEKGWSFGLTSSKFRVSQGLIQSGDALQAYMNDNPALAAVHELATAEDGWGALNGSLALIWHGSQTLANANSLFKQLGGDISMTNALAQQFIPSDFKDFQNLMTNCTDLKSCAAAAGIGFRFEMWESRREWTESHVSRLGAGNDLTLSSGRDIALVGGTITSAAKDLTIAAGRDFLMTAVADNSRTRSSGWGLNIGFNATGGVTIGGHANGAKSEQTIYTNATLTAGRDLTLVTGRDAKLLGAVVKARNIHMDIGRDLVIASRQNTSSNSSWGFNVSVTVYGPGAGAFSIGGNYGRGSRAYTDTPTWIEANQILDVFVGRTTYLMGAVMNSKAGRLTLDTDTFIFDNYRDRDRQINLGGSIGFGQANFQGLTGSFNGSYRNKQGVTYATVGGGTVRVRNNTDIDLSSLNTDVNTVHRTTKNVYIHIKIPGINLKTLRNNLEEAGNFIRAATADIPDRVRAQGDVASTLYRRMLSNGFTGDEARALAKTEEFRNAVRAAAVVAEARKVYGDGPIPEEIYLAAMLGESVLYVKNADGSYSANVTIACNTSGRCEIALEQLGQILNDPAAREKLYGFMNSTMEYLASMFSRTTHGVVDAGIHQPTDNDVLSNVLGTLFWCAKHDPAYFVSAIGLDANVRRYLAEEGFGGEANLNAFLRDLEAGGGTEEAARAAFLKYVSPFQNFVIEFGTGVVSALSGVDGLYTLGTDPEAREALMNTINHIVDDPEAFANTLSAAAKREFLLYWESGDLVGALGAAGPVAIEAFIGTKGLGQGVAAVRGLRTLLTSGRSIDVPINWNGGIGAQGFPYEEFLASRGMTALPAAFKTFDFFNDGVAVSAKTLNTMTPSRIANPNQIRYTLQGYARAANNFTSYTLQGVPLNSTMITSRQIYVAIPRTTTAAQWTQITQAVQYAENLGVTMVIQQVR